VRKLQFIVLAALLVALTDSASGQQGAVIRREEPPSQGREIERSAVNFAGPWRPQGAGSATRVVGTVIDIRQAPVPNARVQLRNLNTGNIEQTADSSELGQYEFELDESGTYVVEMVMVDGAIVALSNAGSLARFETLNTVVQLPGRWDMNTRAMVPVQNMTSFFGMSSATSMTSTTIEIATEQNVRPRDPGVQLSPS